MACTVEDVRRAELASARAWFPIGVRVLELGGGTGYQAHLLASWGCAVESLDLPAVADAASAYYPVRPYDGREIPYADASFDRVFTSNVLEHVAPLSEFLEETRRVIRPDGCAVHIVPSSAWRLWTSVAHYPYLLLYIAARARGLTAPRTSFPPPPSGAEIANRRGRLHLVKRAIFPGPHGAYHSATAEVINYSRRRWERTFKHHGFQIADVFATGVFYAGYGVVARLSLSHRERLARFLGSACNVFVLKPRS